MQMADAEWIYIIPAPTLTVARSLIFKVATNVLQSDLGTLGSITMSNGSSGMIEPTFVAHNFTRSTGSFLTNGPRNLNYSEVGEGGALQNAGCISTNTEVGVHDV